MLADCFACGLLLRRSDARVCVAAAFAVVRPRRGVVRREVREFGADFGGNGLETEPKGVDEELPDGRVLIDPADGLCPRAEGVEVDVLPRVAVCCPADARAVGDEIRERVREPVKVGHVGARSVNRGDLGRSHVGDAEPRRDGLRRVECGVAAQQPRKVLARVRRGSEHARQIRVGVRGGAVCVHGARKSEPAGLVIRGGDHDRVPVRGGELEHRSKRLLIGGHLADVGGGVVVVARVIDARALDEQEEPFLCAFGRAREQLERLARCVDERRLDVGIAVDLKVHVRLCEETQHGEPHRAVELCEVGHDLVPSGDCGRKHVARVWAA
eukprot:Amastigsp_a513517_11.p2 type:complete len:327 gc:universal Amastigsp_a513517_11:28-1008(+)